jgi:hypothetical protein
VFLHLSSKLKCTLLTAAFVLVGFGTWGIAQAAEGQSVPATVVGMPPTAQGAGWAVVRGVDGVRIRQFRTSASARIAAGHYRVTFLQAVSGCEFNATIGDVGAALEPPGGITVTIGPITSQVDVFTFAGGATPADHDFHLSVHC